jgi:tRNA A-37 threonylcarbamoyl transferase component Bud32
MTYCGSEINNRNIPENYLDEFHTIKDIFLKEGLSNNDILERNICVLGEKIYVIDFGLCNNLEINKVIHDLYTKLNKLYTEKKKIEYFEQLKTKIS